MRPTVVAAGAQPPRAAMQPSIVTIGVFDGVHTAHRQLIQTTLSLARRQKAAAGIITFDPDPQHLLNPAAQPALMPLKERLHCLKQLGADWIWVIPFTASFAKTPAQDFIQRVLLGKLKLKGVVVGDGFLFGKDRTGDLELLRRLGAPHGMRVFSVASIMRGGAPVSSSRIRQLISAGALPQAAALLGRPAALYGAVVRGFGRATPLGFPTANIRLMPQALPPQGVYAVSLRRMDTGQSWKGVMNFGVRPTFGDGPVACEVHLFGFSGKLLGREVAVSLIRRLRSERCFPSPQALQVQVARDIHRARQLLSR